MILINLGRLLMLMVWGFLLFNLIQPFPKPLKYFLDIGFFHGGNACAAADAAESHADQR
ncbi:hypothetical protein SODG_003076 [Sodalis praecaptivus]